MDDSAGKVIRNDSVRVGDAKSVEALPDHVGEDVKNLLPEMGAEEQADSIDEEEVAIVMEIAEVMERGRKDKLPALKNVPMKKLFAETAMFERNCSMQKLLLLQID